MYIYIPNYSWSIPMKQLLLVSYVPSIKSSSSSLSSSSPFAHHFCSFWRFDWSSLLLYIHTYIYMCVCLHIYIYLLTYVCLHICVYIYRFTHTYIYTYVYICIYIYYPHHPHDIPMKSLLDEALHAGTGTLPPLPAAALGRRL